MRDQVREARLSSKRKAEEGVDILLPGAVPRQLGEYFGQLARVLGRRGTLLKLPADLSVQLWVSGG